MSVSESNNNIRLRTTPLGSDKYLKLNINQNFDFLEILSLKISQEELYKRYCSDYGVIVGRVVCNDGVGVPNAKLSVFIPISEEDQENPVVRSLYPFTTVNDVDNNNIRYNLLFETPRQDDICHRAVGSFPEKRRIIDCDPWCEVYGKYYKFTTSTNASGDYMIFGVPTGTQVVHVDVDLSDIGYLSQKPYDLVGQGSPKELFDSLNQFKKSTNIAQLPQIKSQNKTINVIPLWGDTEQCEIGINRIDFDLNYKIIPNAFFIGSIFTDTAKNSINKRCRPRRNLGTNSMLGTGEGTIEMIRRTPNGGTEVFDVNGGRLIDENGIWVVQLPMNLETKITDEFGNLVDSGNPNIGIATKAKYRFKIGLNETGTLGRLRSTAKFLVPNYGDYTFDDTIRDTVTFRGKQYPNFAEMEWNGVYTVKQFISRFQKNDKIKNKNFIGIKNTGDSGVLNPFPWNSMSQDVDFLFIFLCIIANIIGVIITVVNGFLSVWNGFLAVLAGICFLGICPFEFLLNLQIPCIPISVDSVRYCPGCFENKDGEQPCEDDPKEFTNAITASLADAFNIFKFDFIHDWINGTLYAFPFKIKLKINKSKPKFCDVDVQTGSANDYIITYQCAGSGSATGIGGGYASPYFIDATDRGLIKYLEGELFYAPRQAFDQDRLYPTGIYNLGSMKSCDVLGKPKVVTDIPITTFNVPDETFSPDEDDVAIEPFLANINCIGLNISTNQCLNHRLFCELGVAYNSDIGSHDLLEDEDISDQDYFDAAKLRADLECLNVPSICTNNCTSPPSGRWSSSLNDWSQYRTGTMLFNGSTSLNEYDPFILQNFYKFHLIENSFYFYFGITPGKTAIDKLISQYFAPCDRVEPCAILISGAVTNNVCISGNTGSITVNPKYGTPPYKYDWYKGFYTFGATNNQSLNVYTQTINNLFSNDYTVLVSDSVGNICKKTFTVLDPTRFSLNVDFSPFICQGANNGFISVSVDGGTPPYTIVWLSGGTPINAFNTANTSNSFYLTGLGPTSNCVSSGLTFFNPGITGFTGNVTSSGGTTTTPPNTGSGGLGTNNSSFIVGSGTWINLLSGSPPSGYYDYVADTNLIFTLQLTITFTTWTPLLSDFYILIGTNVIYDHTLSNNSTGTFTINLQIPFNESFNNSLLSLTVEYSDAIFNVSGGYWSAYEIPTNSYLWQVGITPSSGLVSVSGGITAFYYVGFSGFQPITVDPNIGNIGGGGGVIPPPNNTQFYSAIVYDSSGQYGCLNISGLTVDIAQSCGFTITATSVNDYCVSGTSRAAIDIVVGAGGVPPFTYIIQGPNYYWSGTSFNYTISKTKLSGGTCPVGLPYTATVIDSCGFVSTTTTKIVKGGLRFLGGATFEYRNYYYYVRLYAGFAPPNQYSYTAVPVNMFSGGPNAACVNPSLLANPTSWWYQLLPGGYTVYCFQDSTTNDYMNIFRSSYNSSYDIISFDVRDLTLTPPPPAGAFVWSNYVGPNQIPGSPLNCSVYDGCDFLVCKEEVVSAIVSYGVGTATMKYSIKSQGCSDKMEGNY